jgi:hypothetical protein
MNLWLAIVAFCANGECAFYVAKDTFNDRAKCEQAAGQLTQELLNHFGPETGTIPGCVKVPLKVI